MTDTSDFFRLPGVLRPIFILLIAIMLICLSTAGPYVSFLHNCNAGIDGFMFFILLTFLIKVFVQVFLNLFQLWPLEDTNVVNFAEWVFDGVYTLLFFCGIWCMLSNWVNCRHHAAAYAFCTFFSVAMTLLTALHAYFYFLLWKNPESSISAS